MDSHHRNTRQHILDMALDIIDTDGMKALTQPRIAKSCGIRQSHLTYYFPRKADLYIALLDASHERTEKKSSGAAVLLEDMLVSLFFELERMRFFLSIMLEIGDDSELQSVLRAHTKGLCGDLAARTGRTPDDPDVQTFVDELRGLGLRALIFPVPSDDRHGLLCSAAARHGIRLNET